MRDTDDASDSISRLSGGEGAPMWFAPRPGEHVGGYELVEQLGHQGGQGVVWLARDVRRPDHQVALKFLNPVAGNTERATDLFHRELEAAQRVRSRNVALAWDADFEAQPPWIAYEYIRGRTLRDHLDADDLTVWDVFTIFHGLAGGLAALHRREVVHRDISPDNVMVRRMAGYGLQGVLIDLGIATLGSGGTVSRASFGKDGNYAPEQLIGGLVSSAVDVWQFGAALVKALTGHRPFPPKRDPWEMLTALEGDPDLTGLPAPFVDLAAACLSPKAEARPAARELVEQLWALREQVVPRVTVRLEQVVPRVDPHGPIHRWGIAVEVGGPGVGKVRHFSFRHDGQAPEVRVGDVLSVPATVP